MIERLFQIVLTAAGAWIGIGIVFAFAFHALLARVDPAVRGAGIFFRALITPGMIALWPVLIPQLRRASAGEPSPVSPHRPLSSRALRSTHRGLTVMLSVVVPLAFGAALALRPLPVEESSEQTEAVARIIARHPEAFSPHPIDLTLLEDSEGNRRVDLAVPADLHVPDAVLYWLGLGASFPKEAIFLGTLGDGGVRTFALPRSAGELVLYSLSRGERVAHFRLEG